MSRRIVLTLSTVFTSRGGIPRFNQMLCRAMDQLADDLDLEIDVLSQDDRVEDYENSGTTWKRARFVGGGEGQARLVWRTADLCRRRRPDLLVIGLLGMTPLGVLARPFLRGGFGFVAHGTEAWEEPRFSRRFSARRARFAFAVSRHTGRALVQSTGVDPQVVRWLPNTLEPGFEDLPDTPAPSGPPEAPEILTVSRLDSLEKAKGVDHMLRAFARICDRRPALRYRIVGKGDDKPRLQRLAESLGVSNRVRFEENLSDEELAAAYRRCALFALPSGQEGFGIVFLEAMKFSRPCIGGNAGGTPEVIADGETGLLVPFGEQAPLERALERMLGDDELRRRMGEAGRRRLEQEFVFHRFQRRLGEHLEELLPARESG